MSVRKRSCEDGPTTMHLKVTGEVLAVTRPAHLATKLCKFCKSMVAVYVISSLESDAPILQGTLHDWALQMTFCSHMGISSDLMNMMTSMFKGESLPSDVYVLHDDADNRVIWFAVDASDELIVVDITEWVTPFPNLRFGQMSVCKYCVTSKAQARVEALHRLSDAIDAIAQRLSSQEALDLYDNLKAVYALK